MHRQVRKVGSEVFKGTTCIKNDLRWKEQERIDCQSETDTI
jgi:hypothetical protein